MSTPSIQPAVQQPEQPELRLVPALSEPFGAPRPLGQGLLGPESAVDQELVCRRVVRVTHDVVTVVLEPTRPGLFAFAPGQYLTLVADIGGRPVERCYTISSPPTRPHLLTVTVKRMPGGVMSAWLHDDLRPGDRLTARGPLGSFSVAEHPAARYLLLSAGSGITPTLSTLRTAADLADLDGPVDVVVVHSARSVHDLACRTELELLAATHAGLRLHWVCEDTDGRLDAAMLAELVPDVGDREVFTCGPPGYMDATRGVLTEVGTDPSRCHEESFVLGTAGAPTPVVAPAGSGTAVPGTATVRFHRSDRQVACPPGTTVLDAARQAGVALPSSCAEGLCGTCTSTLLEGRVEMNHQGGIRPREIAQRKFLPCCSTPDGDIVVDA